MAAPEQAPSSLLRSASACPGDRGRAGGGWALSTADFDPAFTRHAFVGNGYLSQRVPPTGMGYLETGERTGWPLYTPRYTGAFVAGLCAADDRVAAGRAAYAAIPTWSTLTVRAGDETYSASTAGRRISNFRQTLFLRCGVLRTSLTWTTAEGRSTDLTYDLVADRASEHVGAVRLRMVPHWNGQATVTDLLDGAGARRLVQTGGGAITSDSTVAISFRTETTDTTGALASTLRHGETVRPSSTSRSAKAKGLSVSQVVKFPVRAGPSYELMKYVGVDPALTSDTPQTSAVAASQRAADVGWSRLLARHSAAWAKLWRSDIVLPGRPDLQAWVRSGVHGLLSSRTLPGARSNAQKTGYPDLFYPWTSDGTGDLWFECHSWNPPHCLTQIHLQGDIALATWQYYLATGDTGWLRRRGWPVLKGIAEFWAGRVTRNNDGSYSIHNVAGPDEYSNGGTDGVYTNAVAATALRNATRAARVLGKQAPIGSPDDGRVHRARGERAGAIDPLAGFPAFNFLTGSGGFAQVFTHGLTGLRWREDRVHLDPMLPPQLPEGVTLTGLKWQGRTFDVVVEAHATTVTVRRGGPFTVESPEGTHVVSQGVPLSLKTRRPDLAATDNDARCAPAQASSEEPGMYAEAAVDASDATIWAPDARKASLPVDLRRSLRVSRIAVQWTGTKPASYRLLTSLDGAKWSEAPPADPSGTLEQPVRARYVRVDLTRSS